MVYRQPLLMLITLVAAVASTVSLGGEDLPDFSKTGVPFLRKYCFRCHSGLTPKAELSLDAINSNKQLVIKRTVADRVLEMLQSGLMPPELARHPSGAEIEAFIGSVQSVLDHADRHAPVDPGRVTMRRLNRTEYANTVRDLLGIDFNPAEDFPADDVGYGFDSIGDVLTLSPVLMERYLAASESIAIRALSSEPPAPQQRIAKIDETEPFSPDVPEGLFRPIKSEHRGSAAAGGPIFVNYDIPLGKYVFRTRLHTEAPEEQRVEIAILACSPQLGDQTDAKTAGVELCGPALDGLKPYRILKTVEVKSRRPLFPHEVKVAIPPISGLNRIAVALCRPAAGDSPVVVHVGWFTLEGPIEENPCLFRQQLDRVSELSEPERTRELLRWLCRRAYRRPASDEEIGRLVNLVEKVESSGGKWEEGIELALQAVLISPKFLFRIELDSDPHSRDVHPLNEFQLASRLSYFLWSTMPDEELLALAENRQLTPNLNQQVRRMLADSRATALVDNFAMQWLELGRLELVAPDKNLFPTFDEGLRHSMREETRLFVEAIMREDHSVLDLLGANFTFLNSTLARHYGIVDTNGNRANEQPLSPPGEPIQGLRFRRVYLGENQGGLLRQASILTVTSNPTRTSPVKRGRWVLEQLMGKSPPPPPPNVPKLIENEKGQLTGTARERMEQHRQNPSCATCHAQMDPLGFAFENYDAIGQFRLRDAGEVIDASGTLPGGQAFNGPSELIGILKRRRHEFLRCLTEKMLTYALGRGMEPYDRPAVNEIVRSMEENGDRFSTLVLEIVNSAPFRMRRGQ